MRTNSHISPTSLTVMKRFFAEANSRKRAAGMPEAQSKVRNDGTVDDAPSAPGEIKPMPAADGVALLWKPATDDHGVAGYRVYRDGKAIATVKGSTWFVDKGQTEPHNYEVRAVDSSGLVGAARALPLNTMMKTESAPSGAASPAGEAGTPAGAEPGQPAATSQAPPPEYSGMKPTAADTIQLTWKPVANAVGYGVYSDGKLIGHVKDPSFAGRIPAAGGTLAIDAVMSDGTRTAPGPQITMKPGPKGPTLIAIDGKAVPAEAQAAAGSQAAASQETAAPQAAAPQESAPSPQPTGMPTTASGAPAAQPRL
jgi:hypothetical protein